jgi:hypothetical protein
MRMERHCCIQPNYHAHGIVEHRIMLGSDSSIQDGMWLSTLGMKLVGANCPNWDVWYP